VAVDGASVKRRRLLRKTCSDEVLLPTGALPVAPHAPRVADAQVSAGAATHLSGAGRGMYKAFFFCVVRVLGAETCHRWQVARHVAFGGLQLFPRCISRATGVCLGRMGGRVIVAPGREDVGLCSLARRAAGARSRRG